jgi:ribonuclease PH
VMTKNSMKRPSSDYHIYRRTAELAAAIKSTFEPVIHTHLFPRSQIDIFVTIEQQDGGESLNGSRA